MLIEILMILSGLGLAISGSLTFWKITEWWQFYRPILLFVAAYALSNVLILSIVYIIGLFFDKKKERTKPHKFANFLLGQGYWFITYHSMSKIDWIGFERVPKNRPFVVVANHRSNFDPILLGAKLRKSNLAFITKPVNMGIPFASPFLYAMHYLPIEREDMMQSLSVMKTATEMVSKQHYSIGVYPEGKRQQETDLIKFHEGVFNIAIKGNVPLVVVTSKGVDNIRKNWPFKVTKIRFEVVAIYQPEDLAEMPCKTISDECYKLIKESYNKD